MCMPPSAAMLQRSNLARCCQSNEPHLNKLHLNCFTQSVSRKYLRNFNMMIQMRLTSSEIQRGFTRKIVALFKKNLRDSANHARSVTRTATVKNKKPTLFWGSGPTLFWGLEFQFPNPRSEVSYPTFDPRSAVGANPRSEVTDIDI